MNTDPVQRELDRIRGALAVIPADPWKRPQRLRRVNPGNVAQTKGGGMNAHIQTGIVGFLCGMVVWLCVTVSGQKADIERLRQKQAEIDAVHATIAAEAGASADAAYRDVVRKLGR